MNNRHDPDDIIHGLPKFIVISGIVIGVLGMIGCAIEWTTTQRIDWFNKHHTEHHTNQVEQPVP